RARPPGDLADGGDVGLDVALELRLAQLREGLDLEPLVGVLDVDREKAADVGDVDLDPRRANLPVPAEEMDLIAETGRGRRQAGVVDVAARAAQQVAVENQDLHRRGPLLLSPARWRQVRTRSSSTGCAPRPRVARRSPTPSPVPSTSIARRA